MKTIRTFVLASTLFLGCLSLGAQTSINAVTGTMDIDFGTRKNVDDKGKPVAGAKDVYKMNLRVVDTTDFTGQVTREPVTEGWFGESKKSKFTYSIDLGLLNPSNPAQKKTVGKWVGTMPVTEKGEYQIDAGVNNESKLRIAVDAVGKGVAFQDAFSGRIYGKGTKKSTDVISFVRKIGGREVKVNVKTSDPMRFESVKLAKGPSANYPAAVVNGDLVYDYETGNYLLNNLHISYSLDGKEVNDSLTGSIKWVQDPNYDTNGKSWFDFNVRFNEKDKPTSEADAFTEMSDEAAFFAVDTSVSSLTGTVNFEDQMMGSGEDKVPSTSKITYNLTGNNISKQQVMNFFKMWLLAIGPTNDE